MGQGQLRRFLGGVRTKETSASTEGARVDAQAVDVVANAGERSSGGGDRKTADVCGKARRGSR